VSRYHGYDIEGKWTGVTEALAVARAKSGYDVLVAQSGLYKNYADAMHAANEDFELWVYANGTHTSNPGFPESWYMHDEDGVRLRSAPPWQTNYTMTPLEDGPPATVNGITGSSWNDWSLKNYERLVAISGYDGIYVDELGTGSLSSRDGMGEAIDPRTGKPWTRTQYMQDIGTFLASVAAQLPPDQVLACNGLGSNYRFYGRPVGFKGPFVTDYGPATDGATSPLLAADYAAAELYVRAPTSTAIDVWPKPDWWRAELAMTIASAGKFMALTKTWVPSSQTQRDHWHRFSLGTFLLGSEMNDLYYFTPVRAATVTPFHPFWKHAKRLGAPKEAAYVLTNGLYRRQYQGGCVLVNPTPTAKMYRTTRDFTLFSQFVAKANTDVYVGPYEGEALVR
jgi:hypothetical protein